MSAVASGEQLRGGWWLVRTFVVVALILMVPATARANATFAYDNGSDSGNGSLRAAISASNADATTVSAPNAIEWSGSGPVTVELLSSLPPITEPVILDGQSGNVTIDASQAGAQGVALTLAAGSGDSQIVGFDITGARDAGILLEDDDVLVGGNASTAPNVISGNPGDGIVVSGAAARNETIEDNFIGTDVNGLSGVQTPNGGDGVRFTGGASGSTVEGGAISASASGAAIDTGGAANFVSQVALAGGPQALVVGGASIPFAPGTAQPGSGEQPFTVTGGPVSDNVSVALYAVSCSGTSATLAYVGTGDTSTNSAGAGQGTIAYTGAFPSQPLYLLEDGSGVATLADPCPLNPTTTTPGTDTDTDTETQTGQETSSPGCSAPALGAAPPFVAVGATPDARFLSGAFHDVLDRAPSPGELSEFGGLLASGLARQQIAGLLFASNQYDQDTVNAITSQAFGAPVAAGAAQALASQLVAGLPVESLTAAVFGSPQYFAAVGGTADDFVDGVFCALLRRSPTALEAVESVNLLAAGTAPDGLTGDLVSSTEYHGDLVSGWYLHYMRRQPVAAELEQWETELAAGVSDQAVLSQIVGSDEYADMFVGVPIPLATLSGGGVVTVSLSQTLTVTVQVFQQPAASTASVTVGPKKLKLVGTLNLGRHRKGRLKYHWNHRLAGHKLRRGTYELVLLFHKGKKLVASSDPLAFKQP